MECNQTGGNLFWMTFEILRLWILITNELFLFFFLNAFHDWLVPIYDNISEKKTYTSFPRYLLYMTLTTKLFLN